MEIKWNTKVLEMISDQAKLAILDTAEAIKTDLVQSQTVPKDHGDLESDMFIDDKRIIKGVARLVFDKIYARKVYFDPEIHIKQGQNPNAKQHWLDDYISGSKKELPIKYFKQCYKRRIGQ